VTVYVDNMRAPLGRMVMCHMVGDSEDELHYMADVIGVARKHYQGDHYDVCLKMRKLAILAGAREITQRELATIVIARRRNARAP